MAQTYVGIIKNYNSIPLASIIGDLKAMPLIIDDILFVYGQGPVNLH